jgi:hypothetical protein
MYQKPIGISILTNGGRKARLKACVTSLLENCYYRPLCFGIFDNGSTDDTKEWMAGLPEVYGVTWRTERSDKDLGCATGTNRSCEMVRDCEYALHVESDFLLLPGEITGEDTLWMRRALELMESGVDYLYLRRMVDERDIFLHWWSQWMSKVKEERGQFLRVQDFWWSNNPSMFRNKVMYEGGTLPLKAELDGRKGEKGWSVPELSAAQPGRTWIHRWGLFVHEDVPIMPGKTCMPGGCKYGFFKDGTGNFCDQCDRGRGYEDMGPHADRFRRIWSKE